MFKQSQYFITLAALLVCAASQGAESQAGNKPSTLPSSHGMRLEAQAVGEMLEKVTILKTGMDASITSLQKMLGDEVNGGITSQCALSEKNLRDSLNRIPITQAPQILDSILAKGRNTSAAGELQIGDLARLYFEHVNGALALVDDCIRRNREYLQLLGAQLAAARVAKAQLASLEGALKEFQDALAKGKWHASTKEMAGFFSSTDFQDRIDALWDKVQTIQENIEKRKVMGAAERAARQEARLKAFQSLVSTLGQAVVAGP